MNENELIFPEIVNHFNVYDGSNRMQGISGDVSLADLQAITATVSGAGILGEYTTAAVGMFQSIAQEIPFRIINKEFFRLMDATRQAELVLRSSLQNVNRSTGGTLGTKGMRIVFRGRVTSSKFGTLKQADLMNASVTLDITYVLIEMGGEKMLELDKLNEVYIVGGKDMLADIRNQC